MRRKYELVVAAASAGGVEAFAKLLGALPADFPLPVAIVQHRTPGRPHILARILSLHTPLKVKDAEDGERMQPGTVYIAPPDLHLMVRPGGQLMLTDQRKIRHLHSSANPLFESAAAALEGRVIGVVLTGYDRDATDGVQAINHSGGHVIAQETAQVPGMPGSAIATGTVHEILPLERIAPALVRLAHQAADAG